MDNVSMGSRIRQARLAAGLTQKQLADQLHITDRAVSKWERGLSAPDIALLEPLAQLLGISVEELLAGQRLTETAPPTEGRRRSRLYRVFTWTASAFGFQMLVLLLWAGLEGMAFVWLTKVFALSMLCGLGGSGLSLLLFLELLLREKKATWLETVLGLYPVLLILAVCRFDRAILLNFLMSPFRILFG